MTLPDKLRAFAATLANEEADLLEEAADLIEYFEAKEDENDE